MQQLSRLALLFWLVVAGMFPAAADEPVVSIPPSRAIEAAARERWPVIRATLPARVQAALPAIAATIRGRRWRLPSNWQQYLNRFRITFVGPIEINFPVEVVCPLMPPPPPEVVVCAIETPEKITGVTTEARLGTTAVYSLPSGLVSPITATMPPSSLPDMNQGEAPTFVGGAYGRWSIMGTTSSPMATANPLGPRQGANHRFEVGYDLGRDTRLKAGFALADAAPFGLGNAALRLAGSVSSQAVSLGLEQRLGRDVTVSLGVGQTDLTVTGTFQGSLLDQARGAQQRYGPLVRKLANSSRVNQGLSRVSDRYRGYALAGLNQFKASQLDQPTTTLESRLAVQTVSVGLGWRPHERLQVGVTALHGTFQASGWRQPFVNGSAYAKLAINPELSLRVGSQGLAPEASLGYSSQNGDTSLEVGWQGSQRGPMSELAGGEQWRLNAAIRF